MQDGAFFLWRLVNSLTAQTFKNWELIITKEGKMAENTNAGIKRATGDLIKILYLDDYFTTQFSLEAMVDQFFGEWGIVGAHNNIEPQYTADIQTGNNKLGSPSALIFKNKFKANLLFDESLSWLLDCDLYKRMYDAYGPPQIMGGNYVTLGEGPHQMTHILTDIQKISEYNYMNKKYE